MFELHQSSSPEWLEAVMIDFDSFLLDHAACERKASATAMLFVVRYPDREALIAPLIDVALEELEHFKMVYAIIQERGLTLQRDTKDPYVNALLKHVRTGRDERLMDRLIVGAVLEARGCERFGMIADALPPGQVKEFYVEFTRSEARHHGLYLRLAREYFADDLVEARHTWFLDREAEIVRDLPLRAALH
ncbi:MAG: tRNA-(ms[2]io[6]A)-hydroxylase [Myxococcales bacterium]|nr:tRNA-(ms[2]io[6]A)-hydroxylase [Myxococcales bacterium]